MKDFLSNLVSAYWWLSVVIVGILINLISAYLKNKLDARLSRVSSWWNKRSEARRSERQEALKKLKGNAQEQVLVGFDELRDRMFAINSFLLGTCLVLMTFFFMQRPRSTVGWFYIGVVLLAGISGTSSLILGVKYWNAADYKRRLLIDARDVENRNNETQDAT